LFSLLDPRATTGRTNANMRFCWSDRTSGWDHLQLASFRGDEAHCCGPDAIDGALRQFDLWSGNIRKLKLARNRKSESQPGCLTCEQGKYDFLDGRFQTQARAMCGRNAVHLHAARNEPLKLESIAERLSKECDIKMLTLYASIRVRWIDMERISRRTSCINRNRGHRSCTQTCTRDGSVRSSSWITFES
jgi:hypothetical protein